MSITARPNNNGNTVEDFTDAFYDLLRAEEAVRKAVGTLKANVVHGRNYQHSDRKVDGYNEDRMRLDQIEGVLPLVSRLKIDLVEAIQPDR